MTKLLILFLCFITLGTPAQDFPTVPELLEKIYQASKSRAETHSYIMRTISFLPTSQALYIDKSYKMGEKIRISTRLPDGNTFIIAFNGKTAWSQDINGRIKILDEKAERELRFTVAANNPNGKLSDYFEKISLAQHPEIINSESCFKLTCIPFTRFGQMPAIYYISTTDFLTRRTDMISLHQNSALPMTSLYLNYKNLNGLILPTETRTATPQSPVISRIISVQINPALSDKEFDPPAQTDLPWE